METNASNFWTKIENRYLDERNYRPFIAIMIPLTLVLFYISIEKLRGRTLTFQDKNTIHFVELENEHLRAEIKLLKNEVAKTNLLLNHCTKTANKHN